MDFLILKLELYYVLHTVKYCYIALLYELSEYMYI